MSATTETRAAIARSLIDAQARRTTVPPVREALGGDLADAYAVQEIVIASRESDTNRRVGRKVGLTSPAVQTQLGVDQPDFGVLLADMDVSGLDAVPSGTLIQPKIEAEVAFVMGVDVLDASREAVVAAVAEVVPALEIVDTIADNASSALYVLGEPRRTLAEVAPVDVTMTMTADGELASQGDGRDCLGDPLNALVWVAETALALGRPLRAGEVVLSGALGPMVPFPPGTRIDATISGLGTVSAVAGTTTTTTEE